jgi:hypothetical protein
MSSAESILRKHREARLVFALAGPRTSWPELETQSLDWPRLLAIASKHRAVIATRRYFSHSEADRIPREAELQLAVLALDAKQRMLRLEQRLQESLAALHDAGISVTLLKGAAIGLGVYCAMAERMMSDIDLLVDAEQVLDARDVLKRVGWVMDASLPGDESYAGHHHLPPLLDVSGTDCRLELHTAILPTAHPFDLPHRAIQGASRELRVGNTPVRVLGATHYALHVATHWAWANELVDGAWNAFRDLATLIERGMLNLEHFAQEAIVWRAATCAYWTLRLGSRLAGLPAPTAVMRRLKPPLPEAVLSRLERHFLRQLLDRRDSCPSITMTRALWSLAICPTQSGHGVTRPWLALPELSLARAAVHRVSIANRDRARRAMKGFVYLADVL